MTNCHGDEAKIIFFNKIIFFASSPWQLVTILLTQGTIHEIFTKTYWELTELKNDLFLSRHFEFFFAKKKIFFASSPWKLVPNYVLEWMGLNIQYYDGLQPKMRAGIINEHECKFKFQVFLSLQDRKTNSFVHFLGEVNISTILFRDLLTFNCNPNWNL